MKEKKPRGLKNLTSKVAERKARTHTEFKPGEPEIARLLLDRLPDEMMTAAKVLLDVIHSRELDSTPWQINTDFLENLSPERAKLYTEARDLLYRSFWFADNHSLSSEELKAVFELSGIHDLHFTNPVAVAIHDEPQHWSAPREVHQGLVKREYLGPNWVIDELDIEFTPTDLHNLIFYMLNQTGELIEDNREPLNTKLRLSPQIVRKIKRALS